MKAPTANYHNPNIDKATLPLNEDGSVYHINLKGHQIADTVLLFGDQNRVELFKNLLNEVEFDQQKREFRTVTGTYQGMRITGMSTGIGCDNIDIVVNELDAAVNINPTTLKPNETQRTLNLIRVGTCGALQNYIPVDSVIASTHAVGLDGLLSYYEYESTDTELAIQQALQVQIENFHTVPLYVTTAGEKLFEVLNEGFYKGITVTGNGFYGPQGRSVRIPIKFPKINEHLNAFEHDGFQIMNYEMETSALYGLAGLLGHQATTLCLVVANRFTNTFNSNYNTSMQSLIELIVNRMKNHLLTSC